MIYIKNMAIIYINYFLYMCKRDHKKGENNYGQQMDQMGTKIRKTKSILSI